MDASREVSQARAAHAGKVHDSCAGYGPQESRRKIQGGLSSSWSPEHKFRNQSSRQVEEESPGHCVSVESE